MRSSVTKHRDMARSILPSRARSMPAQLATVRRAARHSISHELASLARHRPADDWSEWDDWDENADLRAYPDAEIGQLVYWRRAADKLNHFERWAIEVTKDLAADDRLGHMRALLPRGLIGNHAMSHLRHRPEINPHHWRNHSSIGPGYREVRLARHQAEHIRLCGLLIAVLEAGGHKALNSAVKGAAADGERARTLSHVDDVDAFVDHVLAENVYGHPANPRLREAIQSTARAFTSPERARQ